MLNDQLTAESQPILEVRNLKTYFFTDAGVVKAVDGVDFSLQRGEVLGLVGESGCGKSVTSFSIMRLVGQPGRIVEGEIFFEGKDLVKLPESEMTHMRGNRMSMIFQQPQSSLNPVYKIGDQVAEVLRIHQQMTKEQAWAKAVDLLRLVGIPDAEKKASAYPHEVSGGQAQRVMIAMALALNPQLLIADEPTTALDVTIQAQILDLMRNLRTGFDTSVILITHDLGVIAEMADNVAVMYAGRIVEKADVTTLFARPLHPYTKGLLESIPVLGIVKDRLEVIPGNVPNLVNLPMGCRFAPRCRAREEYGLEICNQIEPQLETIEHDHTVRCWLYLDYQDHRAPLRPEQEYPVQGGIQ
jgi:oligopeptide/dipeptide ABC transporter ATP-binding protein